MKLKGGIVYREYGGYTVVFDIKRDQKVIFSGVAYSVLEQLDGEATFGQVVDRVASDYGMEGEQRLLVERDVAALVGELAARSMLEGAEPDTGAPDNEALGVLDSDAESPDADALLAGICAQTGQLEHAYLELTYRCNERCVHCYEEHCGACAGDELSFDELCTLLCDLRAMGVMELTFTGGEVAVRADFIDLCAYATQLGFAIHIYTNGIGFTDEQIAQLASLNVADVAVSVYSLDEDVHDGITQVPGSLGKTLRALFAFKAAGVTTIVKTVVMKRNAQGFEKLVDFARATGIVLETSMQVLATDQHDVRTRQHRLDDEDAYYRAMLYEARAFGYGAQGDPYRCQNRTQVCGMGQCLNITPGGTVYPCNVLAIEVGNVRHEPIEQIWGGTRLAALRGCGVCNMEPQCRTCENLNYCLYCPGALLRETGGMWTHTEDTCKLARAKRRVYEQMDRERQGDPS